MLKGILKLMTDKFLAPGGGGYALSAELDISPKPWGRGTIIGKSWGVTRGPESLRLGCG